MLRSVLCLTALSVAAASVAGAQEPLAATDVLAAAIQATLQEQIATGRPVVDTAIRTVDAGGHNVGSALIFPSPAHVFVAALVLVGPR